MTLKKIKKVVSQEFTKEYTLTKTILKLTTTLAITLLFAPSFISAKENKPLIAKPYWELFVAVAEKYKVEPKLLYALAQAESKVNPNAKSKKYNMGERYIGIMQIGNRLAKEEELLNPEYNIEFGAEIFASCQKTYSDLWQSVDCFRMGNRRARKRSPYIDRVKSYYNLEK